MSAPSVTQSKPLEALFRPAMVLMAGRLVGFAVAFAIPMVLARVFDQSEFGTYKQLFLIYGTLFGIAQLGMAESLYFFLPSRSKDAGKILFNTMLATGVLGLASLFGLWFFRFELSELMNNPALVDLVLPLGLYLLFMLMAVVLEIIMTTRKQFAAASCAYALSDVARAAFYVIPVLLLPDLRSLMLGAVVFALARLTATLVYVRHEFGSELKPDAHAMAEQVRYAVPLGIAGMIAVAQANYHLYAVSYAFDVATFAIYAVGCLQIPLSDYLMSSTGNVMMVNMRERLLAGDISGAIDVWLDANRKLAMVFFPLVAGVLVMAHPFIVLLFTDTYEASVPIFMVSALGMIMASLLTDCALRVLALTRFLIIEYLIRLALVVVLLHWLMSSVGLIGAILATLIADAIVKVIALERIRRELKIRPSRLLPWKALAVTALLSALAAIPAMLVLASLDAPEFVQLAVTGPVFVLTYYLLLRRFGPLQQDEREQLDEWVQRPFLWLRRAP